MQYFQGKSVYKGIVMGPVAVLKKNDYQVKRARIEDPEAEVKRVKEAVEVSKKQLGRLYDKAVREVGEASAAIFEVHQMMLEDEDYLESMENMIRTELVNAEYAAAATGDNFAEMFAAMDDEYMKARSADVKDISERLVRNLSGEGDNDLSSMEPSVIVADDLSPSETVQMDKEKILAFVTVHGSTNSHTAILARMMNIPALIGVPMDLNGLKTGMTAVVDGFSGQVIFEPEEDVQKETEKRMQEEAEKQARQAEYQAEREKKRADMEIQKARRKAKSEMEDMKEIQFFWTWGYLCVIFFSLIQNGAFQRDLMQLIMLPVNWCRKYAIWFEQLDYMGYSTGEVVFERIFSSAVIMAGIVGGVFLVWGGIEWYRKIWDDIYKMVLIASFSFIAVLGNLIREYLPFNLLFVIFVINVGTVLIRIYLNNKNVGY